MQEGDMEFWLLRGIRNSGGAMRETRTSPLSARRSGYRVIRSSSLDVGGTATGTYPSHTHNRQNTSPPIPITHHGSQIPPHPPPIG
jgi:hypothetical protein